MKPPRAMSISARTLFDDTKAISMPEKNPDRSTVIMTIIRAECSSIYYLYVRTREALRNIAAKLLIIFVIHNTPHHSTRPPKATPVQPHAPYSLISCHSGCRRCACYNPKARKKCKIYDCNRKFYVKFSIIIVNFAFLANPTPLYPYKF